jgi:hypothetical protein
MKKLFPILILIVAVLFALPVSAQESEEGLVLNFNRDFGYGGFGGDIQGRFSLKVVSPQDLVRVEYYLDGERVFEGTEPPFKWQFNTASFPEGRHTFDAIGYRADGSEVHAAQFTRIFLSAENAWSNVGEMMVPVLALALLATLLGVLVPVLLGRKKQYTPGVYGVAGGAICPRCTFPYSRNMFSPNLLMGKLERCPHCGKWAIVPRASVQALAAAEERYTAENRGTIQATSEEEKLRRSVEDSRYED